MNHPDPVTRLNAALEGAAFGGNVRVTRRFFFFVLLLGSLYGDPVAAQERVAFEGRPIKKVQVSFDSVLESYLTGDEGLAFSVRIVEQNGRFYWASREMKEMQRDESGAYITYHALDGSGYVRVAGPMLSDLLPLLPPDMRRGDVEYMEHLITQFASITYYGKRW